MRSRNLFHRKCPRRSSGKPANNKSTVLPRLPMVNHPSRHHRKPRSAGGTDRPENIFLTDQAKHDSYNSIFADGTFRSIWEILQELRPWNIPNAKMKFHLNRLFGKHSSMQHWVDTLNECWINPHFILVYKKDKVWLYVRKLYIA